MEDDLKLFQREDDLNFFLMEDNLNYFQMRDNLIFFQMKDDLIFSQMDNLNILVNGRRPHSHSNERQPQYSCKWETTSKVNNAISNIYN